MADKKTEEKTEGPRTIRESGDPLQGAPNEHQSYADWRKLADVDEVEETATSTTPIDVGTESFGASPKS